jgi:hypothetical protein
MATMPARKRIDVLRMTRFSLAKKLVGVASAVILHEGFQPPTAIKNQAGRQGGPESSTEALEDPICTGRAS